MGRRAVGKNQGTIKGTDLSASALYAKHAMHAHSALLLLLLALARLGAAPALRCGRSRADAGLASSRCGRRRGRRRGGRGACCRALGGAALWLLERGEDAAFLQRRVEGDRLCATVRGRCWAECRAGQSAGQGAGCSAGCRAGCSAGAGRVQARCRAGAAQVGSCSAEAGQLQSSCRRAAAGQLQDGCKAVAGQAVPARGPSSRPGHRARPTSSESRLWVAGGRVGGGCGCGCGGLKITLMLNARRIVGLG